ncbi:hypothetical protein FRC03_002268 [Tulasnella sp. 419]|nr:hypothetical protein FRC03_002268 [Tulasnella sp. 419]
MAEKLSTAADSPAPGSLQSPSAIVRRTASELNAASCGNTTLPWMYHVPTLRQWIEDSWVDLCVLVVVTALAAILNELDVASKRNFPVYIKTSTSGPIYPELAYPYRSATLAPWLDGLLAISIPTLFFIIAQIRIRSFYDLNTAFWGNMWGVATTSLFQVTIKTLIGLVGEALFVDYIVTNFYF